MKALSKAAALAVAGSACACAVATSALADTIAAAPAVDFLSPFINAIAAAVTPLAIGWAAYELRKHRIINLTDQQTAQLESAAANEAGALFAASETNLAGHVFTVDSPVVAKLAENVESAAPGVAKALGVTPDGVAKIVVGAIGKLQSQTPAPMTTVRVGEVSISKPTVPVEAAAK